MNRVGRILRGSKFVILINNPTPAEIATPHTFNMMWETTMDALRKLCEKKKKHLQVPVPTYNAYIACKEDQDWSYAVKPLYDYAHIKSEKTGEKFNDYNKPMPSYIKLLSRGKGQDIKCETNIFGPGNRKRSPFKYI